MAFKARLYRAFAKSGIHPPTVRVMRPSEVAALSGLDEIDAVLGEGGPVIARPVEAVPPPELPEVDTSIPRAERLKRWIQEEGVTTSPGSTATGEADTRSRLERMGYVDEGASNGGR